MSKTEKVEKIVLGFKKHHVDDRVYGFMEYLGNRFDCPVLLTDGVENTQFGDLALDESHVFIGDLYNEWMRKKTIKTPEEEDKDFIAWLKNNMNDTTHITHVCDLQYLRELYDAEQKNKKSPKGFTFNYYEHIKEIKLYKENTFYSEDFVDYLRNEKGFYVIVSIERGEQMINGFVGDEVNKRMVTLYLDYTLFMGDRNEE